jgi:threonine-phosphate decarboxylase
MNVEELVRSDLLNIKRPVHGGLGWKYQGVEDFSSNLNPLGPPPQVRDYILQAADKLIYYPDDSGVELKDAISRRFGVNKDNIMLGAGSAELIRLFPDVFINKGDGVIMPRPTFAEYQFALKMRGASIHDFPLCEIDGFHFDFARLNYMIESGSKAVYICNPNNPTGVVESRKRIVEIIDECERQNTLVFLDETLLELVDNARDLTCIAEAEGHDNLFIIRSFTKCFAIPGMRVGYAIGSKDVIRHMDNARLAWNLGQVEMHVAARLLDDCYGHIEAAARLMAEEKSYLLDAIKKTEVVTASRPDAFFFFNRVNGGLDSKQLRELLLRSNVLIRDCGSFGRPFEKFARFAIKTHDRNVNLVEAFKRTAEIMENLKSKGE